MVSIIEGSIKKSQQLKRLKTWWNCKPLLETLAMFLYNTKSNLVIKYSPFKPMLVTTQVPLSRRLRRPSKKGGIVGTPQTPAGRTLHPLGKGVALKLMPMGDTPRQGLGTSVPLHPLWVVTLNSILEAIAGRWVKFPENSTCVYCF